MMGEFGTASFVKNAMVALHGTAKSHKDLLDACNMFEPHLAGVPDTGLEDDPDIMKQYEDLTQQKERRASAQAARSKELSVHPVEQPRSSRVGESSGSRVRRFIPVVPDGMSVERARELVPPGFSSPKDTTREHRWTIRSKLFGGDGSKSKSFGRMSATSDWPAMTVLLVGAWRLHREATGEPCPFDFEGVL